MRNLFLHTARNDGFTLIEVLMATALAGIILTGIITVFLGQSHSYQVQIATAALQQNLRAAMNMMSRDILMAGYYTGLDGNVYPGCVDWNPLQKGKEALRPYLHGVNHIVGIPHFRDGSDSIVIVKAGDDTGRLGVDEGVQKGSVVIVLHSLDLNATGAEDLNTGGSRFGILIKADLTRGEMFQIMNIDKDVAVVGKGKINHLTVKHPFTASYSKNDIIARADIIIYRVDDANANFPRSILARKNVGNGNKFQAVAENIVDLQCAYILNNGSETNDPAGKEVSIRAVNFRLTGETYVPRKGKIRRTLESIISVRNTPK